MSFHENNRQKLVEICNGGMFVFSGYDAMQLSGDMEAVFLQEGSFWWLSGIEEPGWKIIFGNGMKTTLFRPESSDVQITFDGSLSDDEARALSGASSVLPMSEFEHELRQHRRVHPRVNTARPGDQGHFVHNPAPLDTVRLLDRIFANVDDCSNMVHELRAIKQPEEIERIRKAVNLTIDAFRHVKDTIDAHKSENAVEAEFTYLFRQNNAHHAYHPIVAAGGHACTLHYGKNNATFTKKQGILIDIGARYKGYSADITRTYCASPTKRFLAVHQAVEKAHFRCIALLKPDVLVAEYIASVDEIMKDALEEVGLLPDRSDTEAYRRYFPHSISHGLGIDTHDSLGRPRYFRPGMVLTVEPGIYIPEENIGVRIEDDILITSDGNENLSGALSTKL